MLLCCYFALLFLRYSLIHLPISIVFYSICQRKVNFVYSFAIFMEQQVVEEKIANKQSFLGQYLVPLYFLLLFAE